MTPLPQGKNIVVYGAGGGIGRGVAATFAREGGPMTMLGRPPRLQQVADTAAFVPSDRAAGITGTVVNVTCGLVVG